MAPQDPGALTYVPVGAIQAGKLDVVLPCISPIDAAVDVVQGEAIGPSYLGVNDDAAVGAIHADLPDQGVVPPVCPVQVTGDGAEEQREAESSPSHSSECPSRGCTEAMGREKQPRVPEVRREDLIPSPSLLDYGKMEEGHRGEGAGPPGSHPFWTSTTSARGSRRPEFTRTVR